MFNKFKKLSEMFSNKKTGLTLKSKEQFTSDNSKLNFHVFIIVLSIVSAVFDVLKITPIYENNIMKHVLNTNHILSYGIGSLLKGIIVVFFTGLIFEQNKDLNTERQKLDQAKTDYENTNDENTKNAYTDALEDYNNTQRGLYMFAIFSFILVVSLILDIIQFTPLMQNQYINQFVTMNVHAQTIGLIILKLIVPAILSS